MPAHSNHVLIIEDELPLVRVLAEELRDHGFTVSTASNGREGLHIALTEHPDLILVDIVMPEMDGITMLKKLRKNSWGSKVPVIILTNISDAAKIDESFDSGVHDYIVKADWELEDIVRKARARLAIPV
ncbi:MAG: response regulator [Candidatus Andersenbacteria bacterium]